MGKKWRLREYGGQIKNDLWLDYEKCVVFGKASTRVPVPSCSGSSGGSWVELHPYNSYKDEIREVELCGVGNADFCYKLIELKNGTCLKIWMEIAI